MTREQRATAVAIGFGTAIAMWTFGFLARIPPVVAPSPLVLALLVITMIAGGAISGRTGGGAGAGALAGVVTALVNLLVLGSLLSGEQTNQIVPAAAIWIPGSLVAGGLLGTVGGALGKAFLPSESVPEATGLLARIAALATLVLVMIGGLVTSKEAGLAVVDWPNSYGYNMFLFPLAKMTGGIYYEHAHRLFGSLVGLTTVFLAVRIFLTDARRSLRLAAAVAVLLVVGQGVLGGLRVTGFFTLSDSPDVTRPSQALAMIHGITGQIFFAWMVAIAATVSRTWREGTREPLPPGDADRGLAATLVVLLFGQLVLGVHLRHMGTGLAAHITGAVVVAAAATAVAVRMLGQYDKVPVLRKTGGALVGHVWTQILFGAIAFMATRFREPGAEPGTFEVIAATAHQTLGALLLANAVIAWLWIRRLVPRVRDRAAPAAVAATP